MKLEMEGAVMREAKGVGLRAREVNRTTDKGLGWRGRGRKDESHDQEGLGSGRIR